MTLRYFHYSCIVLSFKIKYFLFYFKDLLKLICVYLEMGADYILPVVDNIYFKEKCVPIVYSSSHDFIIRVTKK